LEYACVFTGVLCLHGLFRVLAYLLSYGNRVRLFFYACFLFEAVILKFKEWLGQMCTRKEKLKELFLSFLDDPKVKEKILLLVNSHNNLNLTSTTDFPNTNQNFEIEKLNYQNKLQAKDSQIADLTNQLTIAKNKITKLEDQLLELQHHSETKIREAEKNSIVDEYADKQDEMLVGTLAMEDARNYYVELGRTRGILPKSETIPGEELKMGSNIRVYVTKVEASTKGPLILLSRKHYGFVKRLFESEIPELADGLFYYTQ
jgi:hypothetical protein